MELLAFEGEHDGGGMPRSDGDVGLEAGTTVSTLAVAEEGEQTEGGIGAAGQAGEDTESQLQANAGTGAAGQAGEDTEAQPQANAGTGAAGQAGEDTESQLQANADTGAAEPAEEHIETALELEDGADVQTGGWGIIVSAEDYEALLRIVQAEAGNEDTKGKILVANVVLNRVVDERFPNSVYDVIFQRSGGKAQFSPVASGSYYKVVVTEDTREAVNRALAGEDYSEGALFFAARRYAGSSQMRWFDECLTKLFSYGGHEFFTS
ncbi:MAG: cell wall hydrolase [Lachnospiraceae bacterium]|nr:cell wall hydrolase [Lachnospiraceae bacterium]